MSPIAWKKSTGAMTRNKGNGDRIGIGSGNYKENAGMVSADPRKGGEHSNLVMEKGSRNKWHL